MLCYTRVEGGDACWKLLASCSYRESRAQGSWWDCSNLDRRSQGISRYINAPKMVFGPKGTVVAKGGCFVEIWVC